MGRGHFFYDTTVYWPLPIIKCMKLFETLEVDDKTLHPKLFKTG